MVGIVVRGSVPAGDLSGGVVALGPRMSRFYHTVSRFRAYLDPMVSQCSLSVLHAGHDVLTMLVSRRSLRCRLGF